MIATQLVEQLLLTLEICISNPALGKFDQLS